MGPYGVFIVAPQRYPMGVDLEGRKGRGRTRNMSDNTKKRTESRTFPWNRILISNFFFN